MLMEGRATMVGAAVFVYGLLMSFIFSGVARNAKLDRPNPAMVSYVGYLLVGMTAGGAIILFAQALSVALGTPLLDLPTR